MRSEIIIEMKTFAFFKCLVLSPLKFLCILCHSEVKQVIISIRTVLCNLVEVQLSGITLSWITHALLAPSHSRRGTASWIKIEITNALICTLYFAQMFLPLVVSFHCGKWGFQIIHSLQIYFWLGIVLGKIKRLLYCLLYGWKPGLFVLDSNNKRQWSKNDKKSF